MIKLIIFPVMSKQSGYLTSKLFLLSLFFFLFLYLFDFELPCTNRTDLYSVAFIDIMQLGNLLGLAKIRNLNLFQYFGGIGYTISPYILSQGEKRG